MADERDFELLDDYLANRMDEEDRATFEQKLKADPDLKGEYALQKGLIKGIKEARIAELKSMLNNVAVPSAGGGNSIASKIVMGTVVTIMIAAAAYWFVKDDEAAVPEQKIQTERQIPAEKPEAAPETEPQSGIQKQEAAPSEQRSAPTDKNQTSAGTEQRRPSLAKRPDLLPAPATRNSNPENNSDGSVADARGPDEDSSTISTERSPSLTLMKSSVAVEIKPNDMLYSFHYQFSDGRLLLFGPFQKDACQVMELNADGQRSVYLSYKDQFYHIEETGTLVKQLAPVIDAELIRKLSAYGKTG